MSSFLIGRPTTPVFFCAVVLCVSFISRRECQATVATTTPPPTTPPPSTPCSAYKLCDTCVPHAHCLWCFSTNNCTDYPVSWLLPPASVCPLSQARWAVCWMNFEALIITLGVLAGIILLSIIACCCCCCCCKKSHSGPDRDEERYSRRREEISQHSEERKGERRAKHDEIRRKYGLIGDGDHPYSKFENE